MSQITITAPAKLNLGLEILGRRTDGYHEVKTVLQTVTIVDQITLAPSATDQLFSPDLNIAASENLALRAARLVANHIDLPPITITLEKGIPAAAGLGGASSDAAATIRGTLALTQHTVTAETCNAIAAKLGSDVPFFLTGGTALATGRGEQITQLQPLQPVWFVVAIPNVEIAQKTAHMYRQLTADDFSDGTTIDHIVAAITSGNIPDWTFLPNPFARPLFATYPAVATLRDTFLQAGAPFVAVTGAGPGLFTALPDYETAEVIAQTMIKKTGDSIRIFTCTTLSTSPQLTTSLNTSVTAQFGMNRVQQT